MGGEGDALFGDFPQPRQGKNLEAAGICKDRAVPVHHLMEPAQCPDDVVAGPQVQMVGIAQFNLALDVFQVVGAESSLDGALGAHIHEYRRLYHSAVGAGKAAAAGAALGFNNLKHLLLLSRGLFPAVPGGLFISFCSLLPGGILLQHSVKIAGIALVLFFQPLGDPGGEPQSAAADHQEQNQENKRRGSFSHISFQ